MEAFTLEKGSRFIDLNKSFDEIKLAWVGSKRDDDTEQLYVKWYNYPDEPTEIKLEEYTGRAFPDLNGPFLDLSDFYKELRIKSNSANQDFINCLYNAPSQKLSVGDAIQKLSEIANIHEEAAEAVLKLEVAKGLLDYTEQKSGNYIKLSAAYHQIEDEKRFLSTIVDDLSSKSDRIGLIIKHHPTTGNYREKLLVTILRKYIPTKYHVATGFIYGASKQIDILIYDQQNYIPIFREDDLVVVKPDSVRAIIEVKTTLDSDSLWEALEGITEVCRMANYATPPFKGIFAFDSNYKTTDGVVDRVKNFYNDESGSFTSQLLFDIVDSICIPGKHIVFSHYVTRKSRFFNQTVSPALYSFENKRDVSVETASFFNDLFWRLDVEKRAKKTNLNHYEMLGEEIDYSFKGFIHENWVPQTSFHNEHDFTQESIEARVQDVENWIGGKVSSDELYDKYFGSLKG